MFDEVLYSWTHRLHAVKLWLRLNSTSKPHFCLKRAERWFDLKLNKFVAESCFYFDAEVAIVVNFIVYEYIIIRMHSSNLVSKHATSSTCRIDLCIIEASNLIKSNLAIGIKNENWQDLVRFQVFDNKVKTASVLLCVKCQYCDTGSPILCVN